MQPTSSFVKRVYIVISPSMASAIDPKYTRPSFLSKLPETKTKISSTDESCGPIISLSSSANSCIFMTAEEVEATLPLVKACYPQAMRLQAIRLRCDSLTDTACKVQHLIEHIDQVDCPAAVFFKCRNEPVTRVFMFQDSLPLTHLYFGLRLSLDIHNKAYMPLS